MATSNNPTQNPERGGRSPDLIFPQHLAQLIAQDVSHPHLTITNNEDQETIFLPVEQFRKANKNTVWAESKKII